MRIIPFEPAHLALMDEPHQAIKWMTPDIAAFAARHFALTGATEDGAVVGCAGIAEMEASAPVAWAAFSPLLARFKIPAVRLIHRVLSARRDPRIEAYILPDHPKAAAFAERLHFRFERILSGLHPSGADVHLYAREGIQA